MYVCATLFRFVVDLWRCDHFVILASGQSRVVYYLRRQKDTHTEGTRTMTLTTDQIHAITVEMGILFAQHAHDKGIDWDDVDAVAGCACDFCDDHCPHVDACNDGQWYYRCDVWEYSMGEDL